MRRVESHEQYALTLFAERDGLPEFAGTTYEDHVAAWQAVDLSEQRHLWAKASIAASLVRHVNQWHGQEATDVQRFAADVRCSKQWVMVLARTHRTFAGKPGFTSNLPLSFKHYTIAACMTETPANALAAVQEAADQEWSTRELAEALLARRHAAKRLQPWPAGTYRVIYADPPWTYASPQHTDEAQETVLGTHYASLSLEDLCALPVRGLARDEAVLFLWVTSPLLFSAAAVFEAWGFDYKASVVWDKVKHNVGYYVSVRHEFLLIATRGSCLPDVPTLHDSVVSLERTAHSAKPEAFRAMIDAMYPPVGRDRVELFSRGALPPHWDAWGNE